MKTTTPTTVTSKDLAEQKLAPIRLWAHSERGAINRLTEKLKELSGEDITRQTVSRWLAKDPAKRQQPSYGWGLHLEAAYTALVG